MTRQGLSRWGASLAFFLWCCSLFTPPLGAEGTNSAAFPHIAHLDNHDDKFKQYSDAVELARRYLFSPDYTMETIAEALTIYTYTAEKSIDLLNLAARCTIPLSSLATLNHISHRELGASVTTLLLPSAPGLFIAEEPVSDLERLLASTRQNERGIIITVNGERFRFVPGLDFNPTELAFFHNKPGFFRYPLRQFRLTSPFGRRVDPISGAMSTHGGLDLAAPLGTEVYAAREGLIAETGTDAIYGNFIIIRHDSNWVSLYGHLSKIETTQGRRVASGALIGRVGSTGRSTGPHLHFEVRQNGTAQDPTRYLFQSH
ncbi:MAG: M23 family metallopeptidase [Treponema sp.]|jgi:hypothetical protein|nr:M23 family metallopeptidase [Treponema sp.]